MLHPSLLPKAVREAIKTSGETVNTVTGIKSIARPDADAGWAMRKRLYYYTKTDNKNIPMTQAECSAMIWECKVELGVATLKANLPFGVPKVSKKTGRLYGELNEAEWGEGTKFARVLDSLHIRYQVKPEGKFWVFRKA